MENDTLQTLVRVGMFYVPFLFSLCLHEFAHGWVAMKKGDNTAKMMGRLTLNPMAHADTVGTFILPIMSLLMNSPIFFGWAQPVPVNERNLKHPKRDMFWISLAGPLSNVLLAFIGSFVFVFAQKHMTGFSESVSTLMMVFIQLNLFLAIFNLLPIHPLDGGKVIARFLPPKWDRALEENQGKLSILLLILFISGAMAFLRYPVFLLATFFLSIANMIL